MGSGMDLLGLVMVVEGGMSIFLFCLLFRSFAVFWVWKRAGERILDFYCFFCLFFAVMKNDEIPRKQGRFTDMIYLQ